MAAPGGGPICWFPSCPFDLDGRSRDAFISSDATRPTGPLCHGCCRRCWPTTVEYAQRSRRAGSLGECSTQGYRDSICATCGKQQLRRARANNQVYRPQLYYPCRTRDRRRRQFSAELLRRMQLTQRSQEKTGLVIGLSSNRYTHIPLRAVTSARKTISLDSALWRAAMDVTGPTVVDPSIHPCA